MMRLVFICECACVPSILRTIPCWVWMWGKASVFKVKFVCLAEPYLLSQLLVFMALGGYL